MKLRSPPCDAVWGDENGRASESLSAEVEQTDEPGEPDSGPAIRRKAAPGETGGGHDHVLEDLQAPSEGASRDPGQEVQRGHGKGDDSEPERRARERNCDQAGDSGPDLELLELESKDRCRPRLCGEGDEEERSPGA
jgi:hypothetical protein